MNPSRIARNPAPIPVPAGKKAPRLKGWQALRLAAADLPRAFANGGNLGVLNGTPSGGLLDVDLDDAAALAVAPTFLPPTHLAFGRGSKPASHYLYRADPLVDTAQFRDVDGTMLVELRSTGSQTVWPPSTHPSGEAIRFEEDGEPARVKGADLRVAVAHVAACVLVARHWPANGSRHNAALALAGLLLRAGWKVEDVAAFVEAAAKAAGDEEWRGRSGDVRSTAEALSAGKKATGGPTLADLMGEKIVDKLITWLALGAQAAHDHGDRDRVDPHQGVRPFPIEVFPRALQPYLREGAEAYQCPADYFGMPMLVLSGAAIGTTRALEVKAGWTESPRMYAALVGSPSDTKTPPLKRVAAPTYEAQREAKEEWLAAMAEWRARRKKKRKGK